MWWVNPCSERANARFNLTPRQWYGTPIEALVRLHPFAQGWSGGSTPFFLSLLSYDLSIFYSYLVLTLDLSSNTRTRNGEREEAPRTTRMTSTWVRNDEREEQRRHQRALGSRAPQPKHVERQHQHMAMNTPQRGEGARESIRGQETPMKLKA